MFVFIRCFQKTIFSGHKILGGRKKLGAIAPEYPRGYGPESHTARVGIKCPRQHWKIANFLITTVVKTP